MDTTPQRPHHPSYLLHRRQTAWHVILPIVLAGLILIGAVFLLCLQRCRVSPICWGARPGLFPDIPIKGKYLPPGSKRESRKRQKLRASRAELLGRSAACSREVSS